MSIIIILLIRCYYIVSVREIDVCGEGKFSSLFKVILVVGGWCISLNYVKGCRRVCVILGSIDKIYFWVFRFSVLEFYFMGWLWFKFIGIMLCVLLGGCSDGFIYFVIFRIYCF